jgi:hypothetical protein
MLLIPKLAIVPRRAARNAVTQKNNIVYADMWLCLNRVWLLVYFMKEAGVIRGSLFAGAFPWWVFGHFLAFG